MKSSFNATGWARYVAVRLGLRRVGEGAAAALLTAAAIALPPLGLGRRRLPQGLGADDGLRRPAHHADAVSVAAGHEHRMLDRLAGPAAVPGFSGKPAAVAPAVLDLVLFPGLFSTPPSAMLSFFSHHCSSLFPLPFGNPNLSNLGHPCQPRQNTTNYFIISYI